MHLKDSYGIWQIFMVPAYLSRLPRAAHPQIKRVIMDQERQLAVRAELAAAVDAAAATEGAATRQPTWPSLVRVPCAGRTAAAFLVAEDRMQEAVAAAAAGRLA